MKKQKGILNNPIFKMVTKILSWVLLGFLILVAILLIYNIISSKIYEIRGQKYEPEVALYTIISPSMEPNIKVYDVVVVKKVRDFTKIKAGDVITFISTSTLGEGLTVTHRVKEVVTTGDDIKFRTQGDNNSVPDSALASSKNVMGKVLFKIPWVGHIQFFLQSKGGWLFALLIPAMVIVVYDIYKVIRLSNIKQKVSESIKDNPEDEDLLKRKEKLKKNLQDRYQNSKSNTNTKAKEKVVSKKDDELIATSEPIKVKEVIETDKKKKNNESYIATSAPEKVKSVSKNEKIDISKVMKNINKLEKEEEDFNIDNIMENISKVKKSEEKIDLPKKR